MAGVLAAVAAAAMMQAQPAAAAPAPAPAAAPAKPAKPEKVCVEEAQMGSHFKKRVCATPEEWERRRLKDEAAMTRARGNSPTR